MNYIGIISLYFSFHTTHFLIMIDLLLYIENKAPEINMCVLKLRNQGRVHTPQNSECMLPCVRWKASKKPLMCPTTKSLEPEISGAPAKSPTISLASLCSCPERWDGTVPQHLRSFSTESLWSLLISPTLPWVPHFKICGMLRALLERNK